MVLPTSRYLFHFIHIFTFYIFNVFISASLIPSLHRAIYFISFIFFTFFYAFSMFLFLLP